MLLGICGGKVFEHFRLGLLQKELQRALHVGAGLQSFFSDIRPQMQSLPEVRDMFRGIFRIAKMGDEKFRRMTIQDRGEGLLPYRKINVRRRCCRHDVWAVRDANPSGIPGERHAVSLIKIGDVVRSVARSINNVKFPRAH